MAERKFAIRLAVEDSDKVRAALKGMGADGAAALRQMDTAARQVGPGLKAVDTAARDVRAEFDRFATRIPFVGGALKELGPAGLAAGAGFAAVGLGLVTMNRAVRQAIEDVGKLKDAADTLQISVENLQGLRAEALTAGIDSAAIDKMLQTLALNTAKASEGFGKMKAALDKVDPALGRQLSQAGTTAEAFDVLADGVRTAATQQDKLNIAAAGFGADGAQMIRLVDQAGASMDTFREKAKAAGLVLSEDLVSDIEELGDRLDTLEAKQKVALQRAAVSLAGAVESFERFKTDAILFLPNLQEQAKGLQDQSEEYIADTIEGWKRAAEQHVVSEKSALEEIARFQGELDRRRAEAAAAASARVPRGAFGLESDALNRARFPEAETAEAKAAREKAATEAAAKAANAAREAAVLEKQAIDLRKQLGDWTGVYAAKQAELNKLVGQYGVTQDMVNAALATYRGELDGSTETTKRWADELAKTQTPVDAAITDIDDLSAAYSAGKVPLELYTALYPVLQERLASASAEMAAQTAAAAALASANAEAAGSLTDVATAQEAVRDATFEAQFAFETMDEVLRGQIDSWQDVEDIALDVMMNIARQAIYTASQVKGASLGDVFGAVIGAFGFGGSSPGAGASGGNGATGGGSVVTPRVMHTGGIAGDVGVTRMVRASAFNNAPRFHTGSDGFRANEYPAILERGEPVVSRFDAGRIVRALDSGGRGPPPKVEINLIGIEGKPEVKQTQQPNGDIRIDVMLRRAVQDTIASGGADKAMRSRFAITPASRS